MPDKLSLFILGGLSAGALLSVGALVYYQKRRSKTDPQMISVDRKRYLGIVKIDICFHDLKLDVLDSLNVTKGELELTMKNMIANGNWSITIVDEFFVF